MRRLSWLCCGLCSLVAPSVCFGSDGASAAPRPAGTPRVMEVLQVVVEYHVLEIALLLLSFLVLALIFERLWTLGLGAEKIVPEELVKFLRRVTRQPCLDESGRAELQKLCQAYPSAAATVITQALTRTGQPLANIESACEEMVAIEHNKLGHLTGHLAVIGRLAPYMGLLGTVVGMMVAFFQTAVAQAGDSSLLAHGVATALSTTAAGIIVTVVAVSASYLFRQRQNRLFDRLKTALLALLPLLSARPSPGTPAQSAAGRGAARNGQAATAGR